MEFRFFRRDSPFDFFNYAAWITVKENRIQFVDNFNSIQELNIDEFWQKAEYIGKAQIEPLNLSNSFNWTKTAIISLTIIVAFLLLSYIFLRFFPKLSLPFINYFFKSSELKGSNSLEIETTDEVTKIFHELDSLKGKLLDTDECS
ncbi:hypothetical protein [Algoriphagus sp. NF]|uniref:hypothetical protein n=1 Tax=Algoriphagus sp. NF TaxID=2992756 RepID=UPI00237B5985|nr:hypothetical protein [Algoriphagus sp. NF]